MTTTTARGRHLGAMIGIVTAMMMFTAFSGGTALADPASAVHVRHHSHVDADHDGIPNWWERAHHTHVHGRDAKADPDHDGLNNLGEFHDHTLPHIDDTDHDGLEDGAEVHKFHTCPWKSDSDHDGVPDGEDDSNHDHVADAGEDGNIEGDVGTIIQYDGMAQELLIETSLGIPVTVVVNGDTNVRTCEACWTVNPLQLLQEGQEIHGLMFRDRPLHGLPVLRWIAVSCPPD